MKKLQLNKETIARLGHGEQGRIKGGVTNLCNTSDGYEHCIYRTEPFETCMVDCESPYTDLTMCEDTCECQPSEVCPTCNENCWDPEPETDMGC